MLGIRRITKRDGRNVSRETFLPSLSHWIEIYRFYYFSGNLAGVPAFRGYFLGVSFTFLMHTNALPKSESGNLNLSMLTNFPPRMEIAFFPS